MIRCHSFLLLFAILLGACGGSGTPRADAGNDATTPVDADATDAADGLDAGDGGTEPSDAGGGGDATVVVPRFVIAAPTDVVALDAGGSAELEVTVTRDIGFDDFVTVVISGLPAGVTVVQPSVVVPGGSSLATFVLEANVVAATSGPVSITLTAAGGGGTRTLDRSLSVAAPADFVVALDPGRIGFGSLSESPMTVSVGRSSAFTAPVTFSAIGLPATITMSPLTLQANETTGALVFTRAMNAPAVEGTFTLRASGGGIDHDTQVDFEVAPPLDFAVQVAPGTLSVSRGTSNVVTVTLDEITSYYGTITVVASGLPAGVTATPIQLAQVGPVSADLVITADPSATLGGPTTITLTATHTTGAVRTVSFDLTITDAPGFTMTAAPTTVYVPQGGSVDVTVDVVRQGGFDPALALDLSGGPSGVTGSSTGIAMSGTQGTLTLAANLEALLLVPTSASVRATDGSVSRLQPITVVVTPPLDPHIDATFGLGGAQLVAADSAYICARVLASGVGVAVGSNAASRFVNSGALDTSWAVGGRRTLNLSSTARRCAINAAGDVAVPLDTAGVAASVVQVVKVLSTGTIDTTFGTSGVATLDFPGDHDGALAAVFRPDGSIYVVGSRMVGSSADLVVARLTPTGTLDTSFAGDGIVEFDLGGNESPVGVFAANGGVVIVGRQAGVDGNYIVAIRMTSAGVLDNTFSDDGIQIVDPPGYNLATAMLELPNGRFLVALTGNDGAEDALGLARFEANGSLDTSFDGDGYAFVPELGALSVSAMVRVGNARYMVAGEYARLVGNVNSRVLGIGAVTSLGLVDNTFSGDGVLTIDDGVPAGVAPSVFALDLDPVSGHVWGFGNLGYDGAVFRFIP